MREEGVTVSFTNLQSIQLPATYVHLPSTSRSLHLRAIVRSDSLNAGKSAGELLPLSAPFHLSPPSPPPFAVAVRGGGVEQLFRSEREESAIRECLKVRLALCACFAARK